MKLLDKIGLIFKKTKLKKSPEKVEIRVSSIPEWLYKITLNNPDNLKERVEDYIQRVKSIAKSLQDSVNQLKFLNIQDITISHYKKELVNGKKKTLIIRLSGIIDGILSIENEPTDVKRRILEKVFTEAKDFNERKPRIEKVIKEFFPNQVQEIKVSFENLIAELNKLQEIFVSESDEKVNSTIKLVENIQKAMEREIEIVKEIKEIKNEIEKNKKNVFKLRDSLERLKKNARFSDVLRERDDLQELERAKSRKISLAIQKIEKILPEIEEFPLAKNYYNYFEDSIIDDEELTFIKTIEKSENTDVKDWLISTLPETRTEIIEINKKIKSIWKYLKKYAIINEMEDVEGRMGYFQGKLKECREKRDLKNKEIQDLEIESMKQKLYKDLIVLTGYDVKVIYD